MSNKFSTVLNLITGLFTVVVQFATSFFLSPFIVKALGAEANGYTQLASNFVMYATLLTTAFNSMASRFVSVAYHQGKIDKARGYYSSVYIANVALIIVLLPIAIVVTMKLDHVIVVDNVDLLDAKLLFGCVFANYFIGMISSLYTISMYVKNAIFYSNILNCIRTICNAVLLLVVFSFLPVKIFYVSFIAVVLSVLLLPAYVYYQDKLLPEIHFGKHYFSWEAVKEMLLSGIWNSVNQCGHLLLTGLDLLLSNLFISPYAMGLVAVSKTIPSAIIQLATTVNNNFSPSITQSWARGDSDGVMRELQMAMKISIVIVSVPIVTFCCVGVSFYSLWQPTLDPIVLTILSVLGCLSFMIFAGTQILYNVFTASNHLKVNSLSFVLMGLLNVGCVYCGLKYYPQYGMYIIVGTSTILTIIRQLIIILPYTAKLLNQHWAIFYKNILQTLCCCAMNGLLSYVVMSLSPINGWLSFLLDGTIIAILAICLEGYLLLNKNERKKVLQLIRKKKDEENSAI